MFIRKSKTRTRAGTDYFALRLVRNERIDGRVKQTTLLNLGQQFELPPEHWPAFCARLAALVSPSQVDLPDADPEIEAAARRYAARLLPASVDTALGAVQRRHRPAAPPVPPTEGPAHPDLFTVPSTPSVPSESLPAVTLQWVDADSLEHLEVRSIGVETVALHAIRKLGIDAELRQAGLRRIDLAAAIGQLVARMAAPSSERRTHAWLQQRSALSEAYGFDFGKLSLTRLYQVGHALWRARPALERAVYGTLKRQLGLDDTIALYDLTNTYFEGLGKANPSAVRGASKEGRSGAPLMSLGLVLDGRGFIQKSDVFAGNVRESATLQGMLTGLGAAPGALVVLDRGFVSKASLAWLAANGYRYLVMSKDRRDLSDAAQRIDNAQGETIRIERIEVDVPDDQIAAPTPVDATRDETPADVQNDVTADVVADARATRREALLICHSAARAEKESAMVTTQRQRFEAAILALSAGLSKPRGARTLKAVHQRIGRIKARYSMVARHYDLQIDDDGKQVTALCAVYAAKPSSKAKLPGHYVLRSNDLSLSAEALWRTYIQLTDVESVFRSLKSELGLRPVYHQLETRCKAHLWISVLAYQCVQYLRTQLKQAGIHHSWASLRTALNAHQRIWTRAARKDGGHLHLKQNQQASPAVRAIYTALGIVPIGPIRNTVHRTQL